MMQTALALMAAQTAPAEELVTLREELKAAQAEAAAAVALVSALMRTSGSSADNSSRCFRNGMSAMLAATTQALKLGWNGES
jgi:hypothetical protein